MYDKRYHSKEVLVEASAVTPLTPQLHFGKGRESKTKSYLRDNDSNWSHIQKFKGCKHGGYIISPFNLPIWLLQELDKSWRMNVDDSKLNQISVLTLTVLSDVVILLEQLHKVCDNLISCH